VLAVNFAIVYIGEWLFWPIALLSLLGLWALYLAINSLIYLIIFKRENLANGKLDFIPLAGWAFLMSAVEQGALMLYKIRLYG